jgi:hypothetical protein
MRIRFAVRSLLFALAVLAFSSASFGQIGIAVSFGPPALPVYDQPLCPGDGYLWTPGYWAFDNDINDYYWVPGTWVLAPEVGFLWTPPYWGWGDGGFLFYDGYWGPEIGFYGGINYGFGYFGEGFVGGRWDNGHFFYNRAVLNVNVTNIHNVYDERVNISNTNRVSYNGGEGGINRRPTPQEEAAGHQRHVPPVSAQQQHMQAARTNPELRASTNRGRPPVAATARPGDFKSAAVPAKEAGGAYTPHSNETGRNAAGNATRGDNSRAGESTTGRNVVHPRDLPAQERPTAPNTGNAKQDKKYQQQQEKLMAQQNKEREKLQQQQEKEHQQLGKQQADEAKKQQVEQRHQQQTQQLQQRHTQQTQQMQQRQQPAARPSRPPKG